jgi:hypothetical protein
MFIYQLFLIGEAGDEVVVALIPARFEPGDPEEAPETRGRNVTDESGRHGADHSREPTT